MFAKALLKIKKFLILRIHDNIKQVPEFGVRPKICPNEPLILEFYQLMSEIF